jgi:Protein of unknown function (DUF2971)
MNSLRAAALSPNITLSSKYFGEFQRSEPTAPLYHYTNQTGLLGIFRSGEFWATTIQYMNDTTEFEYALGQAKKGLQRRHSTLYFDFANNNKNALRSVADSLDKRQCDLLLWMPAHLDAIGSANICSVSFCVDPDLLSQWRGYAGVGLGYAIGFEPNGLREIAQNNTCLLGRCIYEEALQEQIVNELIDEALTHHARICWDNSVEDSHLTIASAFERALLEYGAFFKDASFQGEQEWRLITAPRQFNEETFEFREGKSMLTPYCKLKIASGESWANKIAGVTVGPCPHPQSAKRAVEGLLMKKIGFSAPPVSVSKIPYRSW